MTLSNFADVGQILAGFGVLVSLIVLIYELKSNARESHIKEATEVSLFRAEALKLMATDDDLSRIVWCCLSGKHKMKSCEQARFGFYILSWMVGVEVVYKKQLETRFDGKIWEELEDSISWWFRFPGMRKWLRNHEGGLSRDFIRYLESIADKVEINSVHADIVSSSYFAIQK